MRIAGQIKSRRVALIYIAGFILTIVGLIMASSGFSVKKLPLIGGTSQKTAVLGQVSKQSDSSKINPSETQNENLYFTHNNITTTVFWAGEGSGPENGYISNIPSAWDANWMTSYGGEDSPSPRNQYLPASFTPKENPFYFALPYNDIGSNGKRKVGADNYLSVVGGSKSPYSWMKNKWIAVKSGNKVAYAQWQDVGPYLEDDVNYVFGTAQPSNTFGARAGLDVSPAVKDYLGIGDVSKTSWSFVEANTVPSGPWKDIVTISPGYKIE